MKLSKILEAFHCLSGVILTIKNYFFIPVIPTLGESSKNFANLVIASMAKQSASTKKISLSGQVSSVANRLPRR
jgi:hypothetical protein